MSAVLDDPAVSEREILQEARARFKLAEDADSSNRTEALTDLKFVNGDQWPVDIKRDRDTDSRPCLTINLTDAMVRRVMNACRENRPRIRVHPTGDGASIDTAKVIDGLIRHIENASSADFAYDCAVESAIKMGWGYWRVNSKYIAEDSFEQDLTIERIANPFTVYMDPASTMPDGSDMNWCIVSEMMPRSLYKQLYGEIDDAWTYRGAGDDIADWSHKEEVRVAEYWRKSRKIDTLYLLSDGRRMFKEQLPKKEVLAAAGLSVVKTREVHRKTIEWYKLSGTAILDKRDWPGKWIPIIPCFGREMNLNGKIVRKGMTRDLRDPARLFNYAETSKTEVYALQPKAPWLVAEGQLEGFENTWKDANRKPIVALPYKPVQGPSGELLPPPARQAPPPVGAGFAEWSQSAQQNFMAVAGMPHDPTQDQAGVTVSGLAIKRRQGLADISHYDFYDNECRSLRHTGTILVDLIPHFYDTQRVQRIINDDGTPDQVKINETTLTGKRNDLTKGRYDVVVDTGPGYQTKREESAEAMLELLATPLGQMTAQVAGDVVVRSLDFPDASTIADRLAASIPAAQIDKQSDIPPKAQMMIKQLQAQLQQEQHKSMALELEIKTKRGIVQMQEQAETEREHMRLGVKREDVQTKAATSMHDTHVKAVTAHDVAEINAAAKLMDTHAGAAHEKELAEITAKHAESAEARPE